VDDDAHAAVDVVVSPVPDARAESVATAAGARVHDARSLCDLARYGVDRTAADAIVRRHLGDDVTIDPDPGSALGGSARAADEHVHVARWRRWPRDALAHGLYTLVVVVVAAVLVGAFVASVGPGFGEFVGDDVEAGSAGGAVGDGFEMAPGPAAGQGDADGFVGVDPEGTGPPPGDGTDERSTASVLAPGLARDGVISADALAAAHASRVDGRSYVWRVNYTERTGDTVARARTAHRVRNASVLRVDVDTTGVLTTGPGRLVPRPAYADGSRRYVLVGGRVLERPPESHDHYAGHAEIVLSRLLRANESAVVDDRDDEGMVRYRVSLLGAPDHSRQAYRATALVTPEGVVHVVEAEWVDRESNVTVSIRAVYDFDDEPNVTRPGWMGPANETPTGNSTTGSSSPTVE
jgi:hypothetical protein